MSVYSGPEITIDSNLVLYYDMGNPQESWIGAPATNSLVTALTWAGDGVNQTGFAPKGATAVTDPTLTYQGLQTFLWTPGASLNCYLQSDDVVGGTGNTSTVWTFSCYVRREDGQPITSMSVYLYYPSSDGAAAGTITDAGNGWYRISRTRTGTANTITLMGYTGMVANMRYYLSGAMLTKNDVVVGPLAGNTTRSDTQALLDLTNNNTLTATSLTYNANGTFSFNGSTNVIDCGTGGVLTLGNNGPFTVGAWINCTTLKNFAGILSKVVAARTGTYSFMACMHNDGSLAFYNNSAWFFSNNVGLTTNVWYYVNFVYNGSGTLTYYVNAVNAGTSSLTWPENVAHRVFVGSWYSINTLYDFNGTIALAQLYNRALSADEVNQNFQALRSRYGV